MKVQGFVFIGVGYRILVLGACWDIFLEIKNKLLRVVFFVIQKEVQCLVGYFSFYREYMLGLKNDFNLFFK